MRVLLMSALYAPHQYGGAERSVQAIAEGLLASGHEPSVFTGAFEKKDTTGVVNGVPVRYAHIPNVYKWPPGSGNPLLRMVWHGLDAWNWWGERAVAQSIREFRPEVIHTNTLTGISVAAWSAARQAGVPVVHTLRDYYLLCPSSAMFKNEVNCATQCTLCRAYSVPKKAASAAVSAVVGVSRFTLERHLRAGYFHDVPQRRVIHNIYERSDSGDGSERRGQGTLAIGYLGRLSRPKGIEDLLNAAKRLGRDDLKFLIAGKGDPEEESALRRDYAHPNIEFLGFVPPEELLRRIDVLAVPGRWHEPLPRVIFEAYSYGVPVVVANRGGNSEIVNEGKTGYLYDPDQPGALERILGRLTPEEIEQMRPDCLALSRAFTAEKIIGSYTELYREVVANKVS